MDWKEFFKPSKFTIILFIIFAILLTPFLYIYEMGVTHPNSTVNCMLCEDNIDPESMIDTGRMPQPVKAKHICCKFLQKNSPLIIIPGVYFRSIWFMQRYPLSILVILIPSYILTLIFSLIHKKFFP